MPTRVLHIRDTDRICGPGKTILETASRIDDTQYQIGVGVFVRPEEKSNRYIDALRDRGLNVVSIQMRSALDVTVVKRLANQVRESGYDILHSHEYKGDLIALAVSKLIPVHLVSTCHGWIRNSTRARIISYFQKRALRRFERVIAVSPLIRAELLSSGIEKASVDLVCNAIVAENYDRRNFSPGIIRDRFRLGANACLIGCVGRLSPEKGQRDLLRAASELLLCNENVYLVMVGDGPDRGKLVSLSQELGIDEKVLFLGHRKDVQSIYRDLQGLVLPSHTEGFPNVLLEALCMKVPVVATDVGGVADIVEENVTGRLVQARDTDKLGTALSWLVEQPRLAEKTASIGNKRVRDKYEFTNRCKRLEGIYDSLVRSSTRE